MDGMTDTGTGTVVRGRRSGDYPALGRAAAAAMPYATLVEFPDLGHAPQIQAPDRLHKALLNGLLPAAPR